MADLLVGICKSQPVAGEGINEVEPQKTSFDEKCERGQQGEEDRGGDRIRGGNLVSGLVLEGVLGSGRRGTFGYLDRGWGNGRMRGQGLKERGK